MTGEGDATSSRRPLVSVDALKTTRVPVRSRWGKLFGASTTDREQARRRLVETLSESATDRSSEGAQAEGRSREPQGFHLSSVIDAADPDWIKQRQVLNYPASPQAYRSEAACHAAGISHRQLDYWARTGLVKPSVRFGQPGKHNLYSFRDILLLKVIKRLLDAGISLKQARVAVLHLQSYEGDDLSRLTLMSDGVSIYELASDDEIIALLKGNTAVFGVALDRVAEEVVEALDELPGHSVASADSGTPAAKDAVASETNPSGLEETNPSGLEELAALRLLSKLVVDLSDEKAKSVAMLLTEMRMKEKIGELADVIDFGARRSQRTGA